MAKPNTSPQKSRSDQTPCSDAGDNRIARLLDPSLLERGRELLDTFKGNTQQLVDHRKALVDQLDLVDDLLVETAKLIQETVAGPQTVAVAPRRGKGEKGPRVNETRGGKRTDTSKVVEVIQRLGGSCTRAELIPHTDKLGIRNPESALYSLRQTGLIRREGGTITLTTP